MEERNEPTAPPRRSTGPQTYYAPPTVQRHPTVRRRTAILGAIGGLVLGLAVGAAAGHGSKTTTTATSPIVTMTTGAPAAAPAAHSSTSAAAKPSPAKIGSSLTLSGNAGQKLTVTVVKVVDPATSSNEFEKASDGKRYVAVQIRIVNAASGSYSDSPTNGVALIDASGQQYRETFADTNAGQNFNGTVNLTPGASALGVIVFEVPTSEKPVQFQFTPNSGFADQTGQWQLG